jgi:hypothetical protein
MHDLYSRGAQTLVASWEAYAHAAPGAAVIAERVYAAVGFRSLGRILEYVPG